MRIASLISAGTEMLFALGLGDSVVAVSHECDWPPECTHLPRVSRSNINAPSGSREIDQEVRMLLAAGRPLYEIDIDLLAGLKPDLIVTQAQCDVCAISASDVTAAVNRNAVLQRAEVLALSSNSLEAVLQEMLRLGAATNVADRANEVVSQLRARIERVRQSTAATPNAQRPRVAIIEWTDPLMLAGNWVPELVNLAGGRCDLTPPRKPSRSFTWGDLLHLNPEVTIVCPCGFSLDRAAEEARALATRRGWNSLSAVRAGRLFAADGNACFNRPGPRLVNTLECLADLLQDPCARADSHYFLRLTAPKVCDIN
jgi:iron complex transport system substrate-binding protein